LSLYFYPVWLDCCIVSTAALNLSQYFQRVLDGRRSIDEVLKLHFPYIYIQFSLIDVSFLWSNYTRSPRSEKSLHFVTYAQAVNDRVS